MKYVILKAEISEGVWKAFPVVFAEHLTHDEVAKRMTHCVGWEINIVPTVHSAGFCGFGRGGFVCTRGSETLKIPRESERNDEDERLILFNDSTSGIML